jgi:hypothetical protein
VGDEMTAFIIVTLALAALTTVYTYYEFKEK